MNEKNTFFRCEVVQWLGHISLIFLCVFSRSALSLDTPTHSNLTILVYHHVSTDTPRSTSISPETFHEHMEYVKTHFHPIDLKLAIDRLQSGQPLPENAVAITFDDGYKNILENGHPILLSLGIPYTIFINPKRIGAESLQLDWQQVKAMHAQGVTFANHTHDHLHMLNRSNNESDSSWLERVWSNVEQAQAVLEEQLGTESSRPPRWLAYPFGEYNQALAQKVKTEGYVGFAQHSGGVASFSDFAALPRFPAAGIYANLNTLKVKINSLAMPVFDSHPDDPQRKLGDTITMRFSIRSPDVRVDQLACYFKGNRILHETTAHNSATDNENQQAKTASTILISHNVSIPIGRSRINCTAPSISRPKRYYWYSQPFFVPNEKGAFPD